MPGGATRRVAAALTLLTLFAGCSADGGAGGGNVTEEPSRAGTSSAARVEVPGLPTAPEDPEQSSVDAPSRNQPLRPSLQEMRPVSGLSPRCPAPPRVRQTYTSEELNARMRRLDLPQWKAADGGSSAQLSDGRIAWMFGDTLRPEGAHPRIHANSLLISSGDCFAQAQPTGDEPLISLGSFDKACWPSSMVAVRGRGGDHLYITCSRVQRRPGGLLDFDYLGASLAVFWVPRGGVPQPRGVRLLTPDRLDPRQINWGTSLALGGDGRLYVYGTQQPGDNGAKAVYVARTSARNPRDYRDWQYWDGARWSVDGSAAREILGADVGVSHSFTVHRARRGFVLVSKLGGELGRAVGVWTARSPRGPWRLASTTPYAYDDGSGFVTYQPLAHPELRTPDGSLIVSMSRNPTSFGDLLRFPHKGRPVFLEVPAP